jgi:hypothetical protein
MGFAMLGSVVRDTLSEAHAADGAKLRARLEEWQALLPQSPQVARPLLRKLLREPIVLEPTP